MKTAVTITLFVVLMVAKHGFSFNLPTAQEVDHSELHSKMMEDLAELLEHKLASSAEETKEAPEEDSHVDIAQENKDDVLDELSRFLKDVNLDISQDVESDPRVNKWPKLRPGQIISKCSTYEYGCCRDGRRAPKDKKGCGIQTCSDEAVGHCVSLKKAGKLECGYGRKHFSYCAHQCKSSCKRPAPAKLVRCIARLNPWGCCWNGDPSFGPRQMGCKPCLDKYRHVCQQFRFISSGCNSGSYGIRSFMKKYCPRTCENCHMHYYKK